MDNRQAEYEANLVQRATLLADAANAGVMLEEARTELDDARQSLATEPSEQRAQSVDALSERLHSAQARVEQAERALDDHRGYVADRFGDAWNEPLDAGVKPEKGPSFEDKAQNLAHNVIDMVDIGLSATLSVPVSEFADAALLAVNAAKTTADMHPKAMDDAAVAIAGVGDGLNDRLGNVLESVVPGYRAPGREESAQSVETREDSASEMARPQETPEREPSAELQSKHLQEMVGMEQTQSRVMSDLVQDLNDRAVPDEEIDKHVEQVEQAFEQQRERLAERQHEERQQLLEDPGRGRE